MDTWDSGMLNRVMSDFYRLKPHSVFLVALCWGLGYACAFVHCPSGVGENSRRSFYFAGVLGNGVPLRCANMWDEGCINGQLPGSGGDDNYLNGGFTPGKRCANMWDEGCINGQLPGSGGDDNYLNGGFNPGKRCANMWDEGCINGQLPGSVLRYVTLVRSSVRKPIQTHVRRLLLWLRIPLHMPTQLTPAVRAHPSTCLCRAALMMMMLKGGDDNYLNGGFNPGKRCANMWDEGCINGQLPGSGGDDNYLNGGFNPGKRSLFDYFNQRHRPNTKN
ncbi:hypothetical protein EVAR_12113_1 [Eumeta japonica]|uniref:Uncharacterized protein n=1 Tax=Eumeta variegata TaxID=151549 RepID=A0A4C1U583_EUMVA|nr:hypothetical protein EVAR_12113_1 [Eumeta japonica]